MTKTKSLFTYKLKSRGTEMAKFMAEFTAASECGPIDSIKLLSYCEMFFRGVTVKKIRKTDAAREMQLKAHVGRYAEGKHFWRVILRVQRGNRVLCFFSFREYHDSWSEDFATIIQDHKLLNVTPLEMKRVTRRQRDRELAKLNPGNHPFITLPKS